MSGKKSLVYLAFLVLLAVVMSFSFVYAAAPVTVSAGTSPVTTNNNSDSSAECTTNFEVNFFYSETCPHCRAEKAYLQEMEKKYPELKINYYLASDYPELLSEFAKRYNTTTGGVPRTFICDKAFVGFTEESGTLEMMQGFDAYTGYENQITKQILKCLNKNIADSPITNPTSFPPYYAFIIAILYALSYPFLRKKLNEKEIFKHYWVAGLVFIIVISVFVFFAFTPKVVVKDFAEGMPFPVFVFIIALADSFNPCAFTVFIILLSLLTYTQSKKHMLIVGTVFIIASAIMYFIFIMIMIGVGSWALGRYGGIILKALGIGIIVAGVINIKDYFFYKKGISLTIDEKHKGTIMKRAGKIVGNLKDNTSARSFVLAVIGTFFLAVFVNIIELGCSAILPAVYMASLISSHGSAIAMPHVLWTAFYSIVYVLPLFIILLAFIYTFKSSRLTEKQGRLLKIISGVIMLLFGIIMILRPELLSFS
jgi:thiol-disulfide isomerase/thioredoxin